MMHVKVSPPNEDKELPDDQEELFRQKVQLLWKEECLVDVTLACETKLLTAHKLVLSAYSDYFKDMFTSVRNNNQYPIVFMKDVQGDILEAILEFMYYGEVNVTQQNLNAFIKTARILKIKGLSILDDTGELSDHFNESNGKRRRTSKSDRQWNSPPKKMKGQRQYEQDEFDKEEDMDSMLNHFGSCKSRCQVSGSLSQENISYHKRMSSVDNSIYPNQRGLRPFMKSQSHLLNQDAVDRSFTSDSDMESEELERPPPLTEDYQKKDSMNPLEAGDKDMTLNLNVRHNIPVKTLLTEVKNSKLGMNNDSSSSYLEDEAQLMKFIDYMTQITPLTAHQVKCFAWGIDTVLEKRQFGPQGPSKQWWMTFKRTYPRIKKVLRAVDFLKNNRLKTSLSFKLLSDYLIPLQEIITAFDLDDKPDHFWSCCEYSMNLSNSVEDYLVPSRERFVSKTRFHSQGDYMSLMLAGSASGRLMSPFMVFKNSLPSDEFKNEGLSNAMYDKNDSGFMDMDLMLKWFEHTFLPQCPKERSEDNPVVLLLNSSFPLVPPKMLDLALKENVILLSLMPHLHHACQPLDNVFVRGIRKGFVEGIKSEDNFTSGSLTDRIPTLIKDTFEKSIKSEMVVEGFRICGIFPLSVGVDQKAYHDLRKQLSFDSLVPAFLDEETSDGDVDKLIWKQNRHIRHLRDQNNDATTSDEEEEFGDSNTCYVCGKECPKNEDRKWVKCSKRSCKNFSCEECLPENYEESSNYICIDCSRH